MKNNNLIRAIASGDVSEMDLALKVASGKVRVINIFYDLVRLRRTKNISPDVKIVFTNSDFCTKVLPDYLKRRHEKQQQQKPD